MKGRRGNGEGSIFYEAARDRWVGRIDLGRDDAGRRIGRKVVGRTRTDVANKLKAIRAEEAQARRATDVRTVAQLLDRWVNTAAAAKLGPGTTLDGYRHQIEQHLAPSLGHRRLDQLTPEHIDDYLLAKARAGYSRATLVRHRSILGMALKWGVKRRHIGWNPATLAELPSSDVFASAKPKQVRVPRALTADEARKFIAACEGRRCGTALVLGLVLGLRPGESTALCWDDLDLENGIVHVRRAWKGTKDARHLGVPKTRGSVRSLSIPEAVVDMLRDQEERQSKDRAVAREWHDGEGLVFTTRTGRPLDTANLRRLCDEVAKKAGIGGVAPYDLRHSATSILSEAGVRNEHLADLLGHVDTRMVERHYRHRLAESVDVAVVPMAALMNR